MKRTFSFLKNYVSQIFKLISEDEKDSKTDREMKSTLFLVNIVLTTKVKKLQEEILELNDRIRKFETHGFPGNIKFNADLGKRKRKRKTKDQVERNFKCNINGCTKSYGSENSLNQHMKLKHPEFWAKIKEKEHILTLSGGGPGGGVGNQKNEQIKIEDIKIEGKELKEVKEVKEVKIEDLMNEKKDETSVQIELKNEIVIKNE